MRQSSRGMVLALVMGIAFAAPLAGQTHRAIKQATKLLRKLELVDGSGSGLDADTLDGKDATAFAARLGRVVTVAESGGDFTTVQGAIDSITDAGTATRYLVLVGPGTYSGRVTLKAGITVRGSGIGVTTLTADPAASCIDGYTVKGATAATVTDLTIGAGGTGACAVGILNAGVSYATYRNLFISASQATNTTAILDDSSSIELFDVTMEIGQGTGSGDTFGVDQTNGSSLIFTRSSILGCSSGRDVVGIQNDDSSAAIMDGLVNTFLCGGATGVSVGIRNTNGSSDTVTVDRSTVRGTTASIATAAGFTTRVGGSQLSGGAVSGSVTCALVYDESYALFAGPACP
ncbi:MAG: hypothetical protein U0807_01435 [Candidatus Binatia bacterium]